MQFTNETRHAIQTGLIKEYELFLQGSLGFLRQNFESYQRVVLDNISFKQQPFSINYKPCEDFILSSKDDVNGIVFGLKSGDGLPWWKNEILYPFAERMPNSSIYDEGPTPFFLAYRQWQDDLQFACEEEFWHENMHQQAYEKFSAINIFEDTIFKSHQFAYFQSKQDFILNKIIWFSYVKTLVEMFFPEFKYNAQFSSKKIHRYLLQLKEDIWFGFEYDDGEIFYQLKKGTPCLPVYFNLVVFIGSSFNKNESVLNYYRQNNPAVLSLGILGNPFFYHPCAPMLGYSAIDCKRNYQKGTPYLKRLVQLDESYYQVIHPGAYGESMKKHAFFYMSLLASSSKIYLEYLSIVLKNAIV